MASRVRLGGRCATGRRDMHSVELGSASLSEVRRERRDAMVVAGGARARAGDEGGDASIVAGGWSGLTCEHMLLPWDVPLPLPLRLPLMFASLTTPSAGSVVVCVTGRGSVSRIGGMTALEKSRRSVGGMAKLSSSDSTCGQKVVLTIDSHWVARPQCETATKAAPDQNTVNAAIHATPHSCPCCVPCRKQSR
jgi:hypothetical protein